MPAYSTANDPGNPTVDTPTVNSLDVTINVNSNPVDTNYLIQETTTGLYVQTNGILAAAMVWQTYAAWGGAAGETVTGLSENTVYTFRVAWIDLFHGLYLP